jgi:hypothetical protein
MLYDPVDHFEPQETSEDFKHNSKIYERFMKLKQSKLLSWFRKKENGGGISNKMSSLFHAFFNF